MIFKFPQKTHITDSSSIVPILIQNYWNETNGEFLSLCFSATVSFHILHVHLFIADNTDNTMACILVLLFHSALCQTTCAEYYLFHKTYSCNNIKCHENILWEYIYLSNLDVLREFQHQFWPFYQSINAKIAFKSK